MLSKLIKNDKKPYFIFYGGEPTLKLDLIKNIIDDLPKNKIYYSNKWFIDKSLTKKYLKDLKVFSFL